MGYTFLTGGARSGKSAAAVRRASTAPAVTFVAPAEARDEEMRTRIGRHRAERPSEWSTVEEPMELAQAVRAADPAAFLVVDCLTLWLANILHWDDDRIAAATDELVTALLDRPGDAVVVSNEVGDGIVPIDPLTRRYRDLLGGTNTTLAAAADEAYLVVAGRLLRLEVPSW
ncbi:MAG TPA: bifunctional adenosylcobinamide kinase/adenosylcobinamide-phosphate guanylyltransferase [Acidimicrobiia bacterium]|nr:bifunctional adenosylcobinamide kinase/adenosylcobinamide-phosphate guanylyltransferase [Acidimicrobiia bacterium]